MIAAHGHSVDSLRLGNSEQRRRAVSVSGRQTERQDHVWKSEVACCHIHAVKRPKPFPQRPFRMDAAVEAKTLAKPATPSRATIGCRTRGHLAGGCRLRRSGWLEQPPIMTGEPEMAATAPTDVQGRVRPRGGRIRIGVRRDHPDNISSVVRTKLATSFKKLSITTRSLCSTR